MIAPTSRSVSVMVLPGWVIDIGTFNSNDFACHRARFIACRAETPASALDV